MFNPLEHPHRRFNPLGDRWVLVSPHRSQRPWQGQQEAGDAAPRVRHDPACYLCPRVTRASGIINPDYQDTFVFDNDFAAVKAQTPAPPAAREPLFVAGGASGESRVICFSPDHSLTLPELDLGAIERVIDTWCRESTELGQRYRWVQVFENKGAMMGCSNPHPHGQIWAVDQLPTEPLTENRTQQAWLARHGEPMLLQLAKREAELGERVVVGTRYWLAIVPYWASWPFETLLLPRFPIARLTELSASARADLAVALRLLTTRYDNLFSCSFPYSMGWHGAPFGTASSEAWQLHAHFYPPLLRSASVRKFMVGFEMLAEAQRDLTPEQAADRLRNAADVHYRSATGGGSSA